MVTTKPAQTSADRKAKRRSYMIDPAFQWKYTGLITLFVFFASTLMGVLLFGVLSQNARATIINPGASYAWDNTLVMVFAGLALAAVTAGAIGFWTIVFTHRICGPLNVLEQYFKELASGRFPRMRALRKRDEFRQLHASFSEALGALKNRKRDELATLAEILQATKSAQTESNEHCRAALEEIATRIKGMCAEYANALGETFDAPATEPQEGNQTHTAPVESMAGAHS